MTDLNLDGLPALQSVADGTLSPLDPEDVMLEIRQLVERERVRAVAEAEDRELSAVAEELPAWAKPVMRHLRRLMEYKKPPDEHEHSAVSFCRVYQALEKAWRDLTEDQLKEIVEDDD